ncbi:MAG: NeuD/PglB/VioB family sugar acetyltransferase [Pseudomonadota bacterium]
MGLSGIETMGGEALHIIGAGGHAAVVADCAETAGYSPIHLYADRKPTQVLPAEWRFMLCDDPVSRIAGTGGLGHVAVGDNAVRERLLEALIKAGVSCPPIIHSSSVVSQHASLGFGIALMAGAIVNARARLGQGCIINSGAVVEHDCHLGDAVHLSPRAAIAGGVTVGARSWIGIGAVVREGVTIGDDVVVGAGAAVVADIPSGTTVVGVPARPIVRCS